MKDRTSRTRNRIKPAQMRALLKKYDGKCVDCGSTEDLTGDHVQGLAQGGKNLLSNLELRCRGCNSRRGILVQKAQLKAPDKDGRNRDAA